MPHSAPPFRSLTSDDSVGRHALISRNIDLIRTASLGLMNISDDLLSQPAATPSIVCCLEQMQALYEIISGATEELRFGGIKEQPDRREKLARDSA
ncbi:uncharacterized protein FPRO_16148 [Fusarium proliferatum ET1]|uniref:Uncharacterized protein n=1 Tax=Fusarium proliferatum (strain ET1) TaxID=1227346 RepID=A0A1L7WBG1_FUSPR|nr:uncharacterized protein FPRO_16148 [Fusarium proliferatum ET1]CZR49944.1 uncharacterized protein FPRO_16148 [Fusarium proliferatum ET1]